MTTEKPPTAPPSTAQGLPAHTTVERQSGGSPYPESLILITGLSGAGRSSAQRVLSDIGYYAVDNLPLELFDDFVAFAEKNQPRFKKVALHVDLATRADRDMFLNSYEALNDRIHTTLLFMDCSTASILKRYNETRRPHPGFLSDTDKSLEDTIQRERERYLPVGERASLRIDTSELNVHELKQRLLSFIDAQQVEPSIKLRVNFVSFGFKHGLPRTCDLAMDVRFLPNPYFNDELREKTGLDQEVRNYVLQQPAAQDFLQRYQELLGFLIPHYITEGKAYINIGIGCTGGKHRSVAIAERLASNLQNDSIHVSTEHRDIQK